MQAISIIIYHNDDITIISEAEEEQARMTNKVVRHMTN